MIKIGTHEFPDDCPNCGQPWLKTPGARLIREGSVKQYQVFRMKCLNKACGLKSEPVKVLLRPNKPEAIEDVTPYKYGLIGKLFKIT